MIETGQKVKLKAPFNVSFPGEYVVLGPTQDVADTYDIDLRGNGEGSSFHISNIEVS